ncbi:MAG: hypothetical protein ACFFDI_12700 [Promethearchaeota archaeon]
MRKKIAATLIVFFLTLSLFSLFIVGTTSEVTYPEYVGVDWQSGLAGNMGMPKIDTGDPSGAVLTAEEAYGSGSTPPVGTWVWDWYVAASTGYPGLQLRAVVGNAEVWVASDEALMFPAGDPRNDDPTNWQITDAMAQYIAEEFDSNIYPTDTAMFGPPLDRDGTGTIFEAIGYPPERWEWIETDPYNPQRVIIKIINYHDTNYYDPTYPYYVVGFFSSTYTSYYNRNMVHLDCWRWWQRLGPEGTQWYAEHPELEVTRPYVYDSTLAHEFQHNIHRDYQSDPATFMNEGCSMYAEYICGYGVEANYFNSYFATPDNSLTEWGDQGDINILADYGVAALWTIYLSEHYGGGPLITEYVQSGIPGIEGINAALATLGYSATFEDVYHDWRIANLIRSDYPGGGRYNYHSIDLNDPEIIPARVYDQSAPVSWMRGTDFGNTITILGYDTGVSLIGPHGSDYIRLTGGGSTFKTLKFNGDDTAVYGWYLTADGWYSGAANLLNTLLVGEAYVDPGNPTLDLTTYWDIEDYWDFGFVQVSTNGGASWTSLENEYTTYDHDPSAHPDVLANLPGLTGWSGGDVAMAFDLSAYAGQTVLVGFRYVTDWNTLYEGWYIREASVSGTPLDLAPTGYPEADFMVDFVTSYQWFGETRYNVIKIPINTVNEYGWNYYLVDEVILVVSPVMEIGLADYQFSVTGWSWW